MADSLAWFRENVCRKAQHDHGEAGELSCLLATYGRLKAGENVASVLTLS
ncbi:MAG: hypothetical protein LC623_06985 [Halobacteriales archaeon]|nr:hypothetical protein [Halobacteriales archaeon]